MECELKRLKRALALAAVLGPWLLNASAAAADTGRLPRVTPIADVRLRPDGTGMLVRYRTDGSALIRYTGLGQVADIAVYDFKTVLVAEQDRNTISAVTLAGNIIWTIPVHQPRCVQVLGPNKFLVCQGDPAGVLEVDKTGNVSWRVTEPLVDASGAVRLPDGNTAVLEGREDHGSVHVLNHEGEIVWTGTRLLVHPRGLGLLPTGELVTSGFESGQVVFFQPYTDRVRSVAFFSAGAPTVSPRGDVIEISGERQLVQALTVSGVPIWQFTTLYPPNRALLLDDGTVFVSVWRPPDRQCLNALAAELRAQRPLAPYWRWLGIGVGSALLLTLLIQSPVLWRSWRAPRAVAVRVESDDAESAPPLPRSRRREVGVYVLAATGLGAACALYHYRILRSAEVPIWPYAVGVGAAGLFLALLQYRTPSAPNEWALRMERLGPMDSPTRRMWLLWASGVVLLVIALEGVLHRRGEWVLAPWSAGLLLIAGGTIQEGMRRARIRWSALVATLAIGMVLALLRLYRLQDYPRNLHPDMAQWSVSVFRLLDGGSPTILRHGFAEIPLMGHAWSALWTVIGGPSVAGTRLSSVIGSLVAIAAIFFITRRLFGWWSAVVAALVLGTNHGFLHFSRIQAYMDPVPFQVLGVLGMVAGLETGRYGWFAVSGIASGYSALAYHAGRITPAIVMLLGGLLLVRYRRGILRRWPGILVSCVLFLGVIGPYAILYRTGRLNAFGRSDVFAFFQDGHVNPQLLFQTLSRGLPKAIGAFWFYGDSSTQYGGGWPILFPACAALLGMAVVAALLRPADIRALWLVLWALAVIIVGGALTINPPFWPRFVVAIVPGVAAAAMAIGWLGRGAEVAAGHVGRGIAIAATCALVVLTSWQQLAAYHSYCEGIRPGQTKPSLPTEWVQSAMGRDIQRWRGGAMIYLVAGNPVDQSCTHPTMQFYADSVDVQDARDIGQYLPFRDRRTIVCYFLPEMSDDINAVRHFYPKAEEDEFHNNLGQQIFTRLVVSAPHS